MVRTGAWGTGNAMIDIIHRGTSEAVTDAFEGGAGKVAVRGFTGAGVSVVAAGIVASRAGEGRALVIAPQVVHHQVRADFARVAPGLTVGDWESGAQIEVVTPFKASVMAVRRPRDTFDFVVAEECWPNEVPRLRMAVDHFETAKVLEIVRMPDPHPCNLDVDAVVDMNDVMNPSPAP